MTSQAAVIRRGWRDYNRLAARYQRTLLLSVIYWTVLGPAALLARLAGQRLDRRDPRGWIERPPEDASIAALRRQS